MAHYAAGKKKVGGAFADQNNPLYTFFFTRTHAHTCTHIITHPPLPSASFFLIALVDLRPWIRHLPLIALSPPLSSSFSLSLPPLSPPSLPPPPAVSL